MPRLRMGPGFLLMMTLGILLDNQGLFWCYLIAAALHEAAHMAGVWLAGGQVHTLELGASGARLHYEIPLSYSAEMGVALSGAAGNVLAALVLSAAAAHFGGRDGYLLAGANVLLAVFNLLPVAALDGGQFLYAFIARRRDEAAAFRVTHVVSYIFCAVFTLLGLYILWKTRYNTSMLLLGLFLTVQTALDGGQTARRAVIKGM